MQHRKVNASTEPQRALPIFRWAGSKRKLVSVLAELAPTTFDRYVEPFAGSACLFFSLSPKKSLIADINLELINTYTQIKQAPLKVLAALKRFPDRAAKTFYSVRQIDPRDLTPVARAARFIFLNRLCFNGLYRTNKKGQFNVPFGGDRSGAIPGKAALLATSTALQNTTLICSPFEKTAQRFRAGDFIYLDPPYSISNRRVFNNYAHDVFDLNNLKRLRQELLLLDKTGIPFLLSYGLSKEGLDLSKGFRVRNAVVQRQISGFAAHRRKAQELLVTNY